jgi:5'-methylthioadenosine phosphorylase
MWAIIGGSGFENFEEFKKIESLKLETPFGMASSGAAKISISGVEALFLPRHGLKHEKLPSEVNYRANIWALKKYGATKVLSISAVGSLKKEFKPGDLVVPHQYINQTRSFRAHTFCGEGVVGHVSLAHPVTSILVSSLKTTSSYFDFKSHFGATYVCVEGPYFSTQAESKLFISMGADIIGMTNFPEYGLAREAGLGYLPACFVTDYDCWDDQIPHVTLEGVIEIMRKNRLKAFQICQKVLTQFSDVLTEGCGEQGLRTGLMIDRKQLKPEQQEWLKVLIA